MRQCKHKEYIELAFNAYIYNDFNVYMYDITMHSYSKAIEYALLDGYQ